MWGMGKKSSDKSLKGLRETFIEKTVGDVKIVAEQVEPPCKQVFITVFIEDTLKLVEAIKGRQDLTIVSFEDKNLKLLLVDLDNCTYMNRSRFMAPVHIPSARSYMRELAVEKVLELIHVCNKIKEEK